MKFSLHNIISELQLYVAGEEERVEHSHSHMQLAQHFFPSCICAAALPIIHLLEDKRVKNLIFFCFILIMIIQF